MSITDLIPWKNKETQIPVKREQQEEAQVFDLQRRMNRLFDEFFERPFCLKPFFDGDFGLGGFFPSMDVSETDKEISITAELPGMKPEDIHISIDHGVLNLRGEKRVEKEGKDKRYYRAERSYGSFQRSFTLPDEVDEDKIDAAFQNGVLTVRMPKVKQVQEQARRIAVKTG